MAGLARALVISVVFLTVIYLCLYTYFRSGRKARFARDWEEEGRPEDYAIYFRRREITEEKKIRRWLFVGVYAIPLTILTTLIVLTNTG